MSLIRPLDGDLLDDVASLVVREHSVVRACQTLLPAAFLDRQRCHAMLTDLLANGYRGVVAVEDGRAVGVMCGRTTDGVGFVPAHGLALDPDRADPTAIVVRLFAELAPSLLDDGAWRFTIDHVDFAPVGTALNNLAFGRAAVFATQQSRPIGTTPPVDVRIATPDDLVAIVELSHIELTHRYIPPIYEPTPPRDVAATRILHERLFDDGAVHLLARREGHDVGLLTVELMSPAPRLCPAGRPYIGPTATHPSARNEGIGTALVHTALDWAMSAGHDTVSVDFDSANPLSRPFWLGLGFEPTGYRLPAGHRGPSPTSRVDGVSRAPLSSRSWWSVLSFRSFGSVFSAASVGSAFSFGSLFSVGSVLSVGSSGSILSIASSGSILSIGSTGSILGFGRSGDRGRPGGLARTKALTG